jgi:hypothetical protein
MFRRNSETWRTGTCGLNEGKSHSKAAWNIDPPFLVTWIFVWLLEFQNIFNLWHISYTTHIAYFKQDIKPFSWWKRENIFVLYSFSSALTNYATNWKVAGSIPNEVIEFFDWPNSSSHTMAPGSTQPLTDRSTKNLPGWEGFKGRPAHKADKPYCHLWADCLENVGASTSHNPMGL